MTAREGRSAPLAQLLHHSVGHDPAGGRQDHRPNGRLCQLRRLWPPILITGSRYEVPKA
jgi:hypothetical protein